MIFSWCFLPLYTVGFVLSASISQKRGAYFIGYLRDVCRCHSSNCSSLQQPVSFNLAPLDGDVGAGFLQLSRDLFGRDHSFLWCAYTIRAPRSMTVAVRINGYHLPSSRLASKNVPKQQSPDLSTERSKFDDSASLAHIDNCQESALQIYDGRSVYDDSKRLAEICDSSPFPKWRDAVFRSTSSELTLNFYQLTNESNIRLFHLTFTYVSNRTEGCLPNEFSCQSNHDCISDLLVCDTIQNCPDGSDETMNRKKCNRFMSYSNPFVNAILGVGLALTFGVLLMAVVVLTYRNNGLHYRATSRQSVQLQLQECRLSRSLVTRAARLTTRSANPVAETVGNSLVQDSDDDVIVTSLMMSLRTSLMLGGTEETRLGQREGQLPYRAATRLSDASIATRNPVLGTEMSSPPPDYNVLFPDTAAISSVQERDILPLQHLQCREN